MTSNHAAEKRVVVLGLGFVGQANAIALIRRGYEAWGKDIAEVGNIYQSADFDRIRRFTSSNDLPFEPQAEVPVLVCVNAQNQGATQDLAPVRGALAEANAITKGTVVLRTTIMPHHLASLDYDLYLPEFLHERQALQEVEFPGILVVGHRDEQANAKPLPGFIEAWRDHVRAQPGGKYFEGTPEEAAYIKYLSNVWNAFRIGFVNEFGDAIIKDNLAANHESIIDFVMERAPYLRYGNAFGGHCLPKDSEAFLAYHPYMKALEGMVLSNQEHAKCQERNHARELFYGED
jgi:UDP-glucose 6-dehydrogenase